MDAVLGLNPMKGMRFEVREPFERKTRNSKGGRKALDVVNEKSDIAEEEEERKRKMEEMDRVLGLLPQEEDKAGVDVDVEPDQKEEKEEELEIADSQDDGSKADFIDAEYELVKNRPELLLSDSRDATGNQSPIAAEATTNATITTTTDNATDAAAAKEQSDASSDSGKRRFFFVEIPVLRPLVRLLS